MAGFSPSRVISGVLLGRIHVAQTAIPLIANDGWAFKLWPSEIQLIADRNVMEVGRSDDVLNDLSTWCDPGVQLISEELALSSKSPFRAWETTKVRAFGTANGEGH